MLAHTYSCASYLCIRSWWSCLNQNVSNLRKGTNKMPNDRSRLYPPVRSQKSLAHMARGPTDPIASIFLSKKLCLCSYLTEMPNVTVGGTSFWHNETFFPPYILPRHQCRNQYCHNEDRTGGGRAVKNVNQSPVPVLCHHKLETKYVYL